MNLSDEQLQAMKSQSASTRRGRQVGLRLLISASGTLPTVQRIGADFYDSDKNYDINVPEVWVNISGVATLFKRSATNENGSTGFNNLGESVFTFEPDDISGFSNILSIEHSGVKYEIQKKVSDYMGKYLTRIDFYCVAARR